MSYTFEITSTMLKAICDRPTTPRQATSIQSPMAFANTPIGGASIPEPVHGLQDMPGLEMIIGEDETVSVSHGDHVWTITIPEGNQRGRESLIGRTRKDSRPL